MSITNYFQGLVYFVLGLCAFYVGWLVHRSRNFPIGERRGIRIIFWSRIVVFAGGLYAAAQLLMDSQDMSWQSLLPTVLVGGVAGVILSARSTEKWERELQLRGELSPRLERWWHSWRGPSALTVILLAIALLLPGVVTILAEVPRIGLALGLGLAVFFLTSGAYTWWWAARKEREGFTPLIIPLNRHFRN